MMPIAADGLVWIRGAMGTGGHLGTAM